MQKYKVEITRSETFVMDVLAKDEDQAIEKANERFTVEENNGVIHYYSTTGDPVRTVGTIYNVTNTDDPFNP